MSPVWVPCLLFADPHSLTLVSLRFLQSMCACPSRLRCSSKMSSWCSSVLGWSQGFSHGSWWQWRPLSFSLQCCTLCPGKAQGFLSSRAEDGARVAVHPLTQNSFSLQGPDSRAEASGQYHAVTFPLPHHIQHTGPCHHPCLQQGAGVSAQVSAEEGQRAQSIASISEFNQSPRLGGYNAYHQWLNCL